MEVLFATDGRPPAAAAAVLLTRLVGPARVDVTVLHAFEYGNEVVAESYARDVLAEAEASFGGAGISSHLVSVDGDPGVAIEKELAQGGYELTAIGAGNHAWLGRLVFGSVSTHVLNVAPTPVLVVHRAPRPEHDRLKVLVGADGSPGATHAIDTLIRVSDPDRIEVAVRTVIENPDLALAAYPGTYVPARYLQEALAEARETATTNLERALERFRVAGFAAHGSLGRGWPATDLVDRAERDEIDLVAVGARGIGRLERLMMGSVSAHVSRHASAALVTHAHDLPTVLDDRVEEPDGGVRQNRHPAGRGNDQGEGGGDA